ncbi:uncharacterized protein BX663DRAFT_505405 [Cokeromyces recurvatus]|uniref:uncharacterized protein n=1 Tax=Cokeromyces recurvatus TaxID=90255 RepID=UPI00221E4375|nr:uncharacterized protein BX663DRAFT_505405 [Cokeromyces recurvatus]KAI7903835.1 hypothetical protein BX663DRAFT_505405 [Cokeromyces recurvatus]
MSDLEDSEFFKELENEIKKEEESVVIEESNKKRVEIDVDRHSGLRLKRRLVSKAKCDKGLQNVKYIPLKDVEAHTRLYYSIRIGIKPSPHWSTIGIIDRCFPQSDFCVTRLTDMRGNYVNLYITGKAYVQFQNEIGIGSILAIKRPFLLKPTETYYSIGLHVKQLQQIWVIGQSLDLVQCNAYINENKRCSEWTDIRNGEYCDTHLDRLFRYSKNNRMELASGDSGFEIRWASQKRQNNGSLIYESKKQKSSPYSKTTTNNLSLKMKEAYFLEGKGLVSIDGTFIKKKIIPNPEIMAAEKSELIEFLKNRNDTGAEMIRKIKGIIPETPSKNND